MGGELGDLGNDVAVLINISAIPNTITPQLLDVVEVSFKHSEKQQMC